MGFYGGAHLGAKVLVLYFQLLALSRTEGLVEFGVIEGAHALGLARFGPNLRAEEMIRGWR